MRRILLSTLALLALCATAVPAAEIPSPESYLGHKVGADRYLAPWPKVLGYLHTLAGASDRISMESAGTSTLGNDMAVVVITSPANQAHLDRYREIARRLANPDTLEPAEAERLIAEGKPIVLVTCSIHSTEAASTQMSMKLAYDLATSQDPRVLRWLDDAVLLVMPSINPDGQVMVVDWYDKYLGTEYEGGPMPWLYHHYVGHDDNRDYYMLTQKETRAVNDLLYHRWFPQVFLDEHQMGSTGPRMFVPPQTDPLAEEVDSLIFRQADLLGTNMSLRLEEAGKLGVGSDMMFDSYWPGGTRNTAWWKNVTGLLTETASVRVATPIVVEPNELRGGAKGLPEYQRRANFPSPWPGGEWHLADIVAYEEIATKSLLETSATYGHDILRNFYRMGLSAVERGRTQAPYAFIVPPDQHDAVAAGMLVDLLLRHGVRVEVAKQPFTLGYTTYPAGTTVIPAAQPYREFLLTMLRPQRYPEVVPYVGGPILPPYDATTWSLPLSMGVSVVEASAPVTGDLSPVEDAVWPKPAIADGAAGYLIPHSADTVFVALNRLTSKGVPVYWLTQGADGGAAGDVWVPASALSAADMAALARELHLPVRSLDRAPAGKALRAGRTRVGLYQPWTASMDEGWTRFLLDRYEFPYETLHNADMKSGAYGGKVDVLLLPDIRPGVIVSGRTASRYGSGLMPPEYAGGIGKEGGEALKRWVEGGGTVVALNDSTGYLIDLLGLPVRNALAGVSSQDFSCPGSMLRIDMDTSSPLTYGMQPEEAAYFNDSPAFVTQIPDGRFERRVVAHYPADRRDILLSGYLHGAEELSRKAAVVDVTVGKGRVVLIGFKPQNRAQPHRTFKLLFNALFAPTLKPASLQ